MRPSESFIGQPIRSLQTMLQVIAANDTEYINVIPDGIYGTETVQAVSAFQRKHMLPITGITDLLTWETIVSVYKRSLSSVNYEDFWNSDEVLCIGDHHPNLYLAQGMLTVMAGIYSSVSSPSLSGVLDEVTADSISSFQMLSGLPATGNLDKITWTHLTYQYPLAAYRSKK